LNGLIKLAAKTMNYAIKPNSVISHFLPGAIFLLALLLLFQTPDMNLKNLSSLIKDATTNNLAHDGAILAGFGLFAWFAGLLFDAIRNSFVECLWDHLAGTGRWWWDIFFRGEADKVNHLVEHYYSYYVFDINVTFACFLLVIAALVNLIFSCHSPMWYLWWLVGVIVTGIIFYCDARSLRKEIVRLAKEHLRKVYGAEERL